MSTEPLYEQTKDKLYTWLNKVFEIPEKIVGDISWDPKHEDYTFCVSQNRNPIINKIELGKNAEKKLEEIELRILGEYSTNPGISGIRVDELNDGQRCVLKEEVKKRYQSLKKRIKPYEDLMSILQ